MEREFFESTVVLGHQKKINRGDGSGDIKILSGDISNLDRPFEEYLLKTRAGRLQRVLALVFPKVKLGVFKHFYDSHNDYMDYYLIWCSRHRKYSVSYLHGYQEYTVCRECEKERLRRFRR